MKPTTVQYAAAFIGAIRETPVEAQPRLMDGFIKILAEDGMLELWPDIEHELVVKGMLRSARVARAQDQTPVARALGPDATVSVDPQLIGGAVIRIGDTLVDGSIAGLLRRMAQELEGG